jgi:Rieske Fe-S protein
MTASGRRLTRALLVVGASLAVVVASLVPAGVAHADVAFRKKKAPAAGDEAAPSGGEIENAPATDSEAPEKPKGEYVPQAEDKDKPRDPSLLGASAADAAVKKEAARKKEEGPPIYTKWQFWAITGGVVVGLVAAVWGGTKLVHSMNGGDVRPCNPMFAGCFGEGH